MVKDIVALIPARAGSKRIPDKNIKRFLGKPLLFYAINSAQNSGIFSRIIVSSDSDKYLDIASKYKAETVKRPRKYAQNSSLDADWILHAQQEMEIKEKVFCVLRPTNPFRTADTIQRAYRQFKRNPIALRGMELAKQHPFKMWNIHAGRAYPLFFDGRGIQAFNKSTQKLQKDMTCYEQNGCIEIGYFEHIEEGNFLNLPIQPFITNGREGLDLNTPEDWFMAESLARNDHE